MRGLRHALLVGVLAVSAGIATPAHPSGAIENAAGAPPVGAVAVAGPARRSAVAPAGAAAPTAEHYVALGDSYSSGVGAGSHLAGSGDCDRSGNAYPARWAAAHRPASFAFAACSGARTGDVSAGQLAALSFATTLVSITIGGNDEGFAPIMIDCTLRGSARCVHQIGAAESDARASLSDKLLALFGAVAARAPRARVVVLGYPHFYDVQHDCLGLASASRAAIDHGIDLLDTVLRSAARTAGFRFADVRTEFGGHEICDGSPWLHAISIFHLTESYHPTAHGQSGGYLPAFTAAAGP